jgi:PBP4 family serine-type D-alanyl-D-alanine carboxypeptidase
MGGQQPYSVSGRGVPRPYRAVAALWLLPLTLSAFTSAPSPLLLRELLEYRDAAGVGGTLAISVYSVKHQRYEAQSNDSLSLVPASTLKLIVTAAALDAIPEDAAPHTSVEVAGNVRGKTLRGELRILGGGDPNISDRFYTDALTPLYEWADSLKARGIDTVRGRVTASDAYFSGPHRPEAWAARHFNTWYGAEVSALSFYDNTFDLAVRPGARVGDDPIVFVSPDVGYVKIVNNASTVKKGGNRIAATLRANETTVILTGKVGAAAGAKTWLLPVRNPPEYFRAGFLTALRARGITVIEEALPPAPLPKLYTLRFTAAPLASLVDEINQRSQNLHAELLLRHLGKRVKGEGSSRAGIAAEKAFLSRMGIDPAGFDLHDACGLSHKNHVEASGMALLLARMARHADAADYIGSLAQPGLDGATGKRLRDYTGSGLVRYKTGTLGGVAALAGYAFGADGDTLAVVLLHNGGSGGAAAMLDSLFMRTALWFNKERPAVAEAYRILARPDVPPITFSPSNYNDRLRYFSRALLDQPYFLGPTGEGRYADVEALPIADLTRMDCVTYIENVLGLARARRAADLIPSILPFRYHGDSVRYESRNHYFTGEWIANNPRDFRILNIPGDTVVRKTLYRGKLLAAKGITGGNLDAALRYVPYEKALQLARNWKSGKLGEGLFGVAFMTAIEGLDGTHTGFVDVRAAVNGGKPVLRHASQLRGRVAEQDFAEYLESRRGKCAGVLFFEFLPPAGGG